MASIVTDIATTALQVATDNATYLIAGVSVIAVGLATKALLASRKRAAFMDGVAKQEKGVVHMYVALPRLYKSAPHIGHNIIKLESFLRIHKIPYQIHTGLQYNAFSPTETLPFISLDGELIGESQFCIDAIAKRFGIRDFEDLSPVDQATFTMVRRLVDNSMHWHLTRTSLIDNFNTFSSKMIGKSAPLLGFPKPIMRFMFKQFRGQMVTRINATGLGWLSDERYQIELERDIRAMSALVAASQKAGKKYLFGDKPTSADCLLFGKLAEAFTYDPMESNGDALKILQDDAALQTYRKQFQAAVYPDLATIAPGDFTSQKFNH